MLLAIVLAVATALVYAFSKFFLDRQKLPPGPFSIPIIGSLLSLSFKKPLTHILADLAKKYGNVTYLEFGAQKIVILSSASTIREAFRLDAFAGRPQSFVNNIIVDGGGDVIAFIEGHRWQVGRKAGIRTMSAFGLSKNSLIDRAVTRNIGKLQTKLAEVANRPVKTADYAFNCISSILCELCFGASAEEPIEDLNNMMNNQADAFRLSNAVKLLDTFPFLFPFLRKDYTVLLKNTRWVTEKMLNLTHEYLAETHTDDIVDIATAVQRVIAKSSKTEMHVAGTNEEEQLTIVVELFNAGFFTSLDNTEWAILFLATNPEVQQKMYEQILENVGTDRPISVLEDLPNLPYARAVFYETLRRGTNTIFSLPHKMMKSIQFEGYTIPKGTTVLPNIWAHHHDPAVFSQPFIFKPERFLNEDSGSFDKSSTGDVLAFGTGKRRCIGEGLASQTVPVIVSSIIQNFKVTVDRETTPQDPIENPDIALTMRPGDHSIVFSPR